MLACVVVGDSIAVGVGQARPECETIAKVGITSERYIVAMLPAGGFKADAAVISLGVNDDDSLDTIENLRLVRSRIQAPSVIWLLPGLKERARSIIRTVAEENGDRTIDTRPQVGRDHLHPTGTGYQIIASQTLRDQGTTGQAFAYSGGDDANEVAAYAAPRHLSALATPAQRISRLRTIRQDDLRSGRHTGSRIVREGEVRPVSSRGGHARHQADAVVAAPSTGRAGTSRRTKQVSAHSVPPQRAMRVSVRLSPPAATAAPVRKTPPPHAKRS